MLRVLRAGAARRPKPWRDSRHLFRSEKLQLTTLGQNKAESRKKRRGEEKAHLSARRFEADYEALAHAARFLPTAGASVEDTVAAPKGPGQKREVRDDG